MAIKKKENKTTYWIDDKGDKVAARHIKAHVKKRDKMVEKVFKHIGKLHEFMKAEKEIIVDLIKKHLDETARGYGEEWKGNAVLKDFSGRKKIEVNIGQRLALDEKLQIAKQKIDSCILRWGEGSNQNMVAVINQAFKVDRGDVDTRLILNLRNLDIKDKEWKEAMDIISDSVYISASKTYYNFSEKQENGSYKKILLNFSSL